MAQELVRHPLRIAHLRDRHRKGIPNLYSFAGIVLAALMGCTAPQPPSALLDLPVDLPGPTLLDERGQDRQRDGRKDASLQLTAEGYAFLRSERFDEAMSKFQKAISLSSTNPFAYYFFGETRFLRQEYGQSLSLLERAEVLLRDDPVWLARVYVLRGKNDEALTRYEAAAQEYRQALAQDPANQEAQEGLKRLSDPKIKRPPAK